MNTKIESIVIWVVLVSVVGIVVIMILQELDIFTSDVTSTVTSIPQKIGASVGGFFSGIWNSTGGALFDALKNYKTANGG